MLADVQKQKPLVDLEINEVGISDLKMPCKFKSKKTVVNTVGNFSFSTALDKDLRGTHMSRLVEILHKYLKTPIGRAELIELSLEAKNKLGSGCSIFKVEFDYFKLKTAPVSRLKNYLHYRCGVNIYSNCETIMILNVEIPISSLCPCSKEISEGGAHNQRGVVKIRADISDLPDVWLDELISLGEKSSSCDLYSLLKREDEKFVTEKAYNNPKFVEDLVRDVANKLNGLGVKNYIISCKNYESIHSHNAYATIKKGILCI